jgi:hypothetical protein
MSQTTKQGSNKKHMHEKRRPGVPRKLDCKLIAARRNSLNSFRAIWVRVCL